MATNAKSISQVVLLEAKEWDPLGMVPLIPTEMWLLLEEESLKLGSFRKPFSGRKGANSFVARDSAPVSCVTIFKLENLSVFSIHISI